MLGYGLGLRSGLVVKKFYLSFPLILMAQAVFFGQPENYQGL